MGTNTHPFDGTLDANFTLGSARTVTYYIFSVSFKCYSWFLVLRKTDEECDELEYFKICGSGFRAGPVNF